ncbi:hypothetical protein [Gordonia sp. N1V]|uniref:Gp37-like protein n=1 Tax=Gordonia sp. N1V TaxID=3034163 RepID=UPI0023E23C69|nr:hypothetical protein [Gordonia sp. N1V]MDF3280929.1 hypothetical protein [Gordonia sp. N1V]
MTISVDATNSPSAVTSNSSNPVLTTASFTPQSQTLVVAVVCTATSASNPTSTVVDSAGNSFTLLVRSNNGGAGGADGVEVWCRYYATAPGSITVKATTANSTHGGEMSVKSVLGASPVQSGVTVANYAASTAAATPAATSLVFGGVTDWSAANTLSSPTAATTSLSHLGTSAGDDLYTFQGSCSGSSTTYGYTGASNGMTYVTIGLAEIQAAPVTFDAIASNSNYSTSSLSTSLTVGTSAATVFAAVSLGSTSITPTVTCGGVAMTALGHQSSTDNGTIYLFVLTGVSTGAQTIAVSFSSVTTAEVIAVSYGGVSSIGTAVTATGATTAASSGAVTVSAATDFVVGAFATKGSGASTATSGLIRGYKANGSAPTAAGGNCVFEDTTGGATSDTVSATVPTAMWAGVFVRISAAYSASAWTGSASQAITEAGSAGGVRATFGGAAESITGAGSADGVRATFGSSGLVASAGEGSNGIRATSSGAGLTGAATTSDDGYAGGSAFMAVTVTAADDGALTKTGTATLSVIANPVSAGNLGVVGMSTTTVTESTSTQGVRATFGGSSLGITATPRPDGVGGDVGGAGLHATATSTPDGYAGGSSDLHGIVRTNSDGVLKKAPGAPFDLNNFDPWEAMVVADQLADKRKADDLLAAPQFEIEMFSNVYGTVATIGDYISSTVTFKRNGVPTATIVLRGDDPCIPWALKCYTTVVPITITVNGMRWSGRIDVATDDLVDGVPTVTLQCLGDWNWLNKILVWPNFALPIEVQIPKEAVYIGGAVTVIETMITEQIGRLQSGAWELVNNITNPSAWFATMMMNEGLLTPCVVVPNHTNLINEIWEDTSKTVAVSGRMDTVATLVDQICKDNGILITVDLWMPGDEQPAPTWYTLTEPTICIRVRDKSGITGPTGTLVDGLIEDIPNLLESAFGESILPFLNPTGEYAPDGVNIAPAFGVDFTPPWSIYNCDNPRSGIKECHTNYHHPLAYTVIGGGRSPDWVNKLIDVLLEAAISAIIAAVAAASAGAAAAVSGIPDTLLDGVFDNVILAFQLVENADRRKALGPYGYPEFYTSTGSTAYTLEEWFALEIAMWDTRGYVSGQIIAYDGVPYTLGKDYEVGDLVSWIRRSRLFTDYVDEATVVDDRTNRVHTEVTIGDGSAQEAPEAKLQRKLAGFETAMQVALLSSN